METFNLLVLIVTSPDVPEGTGGAPKKGLVISSTMLADESIKLGLREPGVIPLTFTELEALIVTLPAAPLAKVEALTLPPSKTSRLGVLIVTLPAFPVLKVEAPMTLGAKTFKFAPIS
ncbi:MAG: hypothetical protein CLLPBCKN_006951 [Chroococcidiopsis cubana SAG 39.79]|nr:hypothetical protein [Chroococcidiopsis cubana SAG 39.79]